MLAYPDGTFVPIAIATHGLVGLTLGAILFDRPLAGLAAGVAPDADFLFPAVLSWPFVHRGVTHTLLAIGLVAAVAAVVNRRTSGAAAVAYASHLFIDSTTPMGVPLLYPLAAERLHLDAGLSGHAPFVTVVLWIGCLTLLVSRASSVVSVPLPGQS